VIAAAVIALIVIALGQLGSSKSSARTEREVVTASDGVVQSSVTGTGSLEPVTEENVDFQTSGTLAHVDVKDNEYVRKGQLLATLDDTTAALTLKEAKATLAEARTTLSSDETTLSGESSASDTSDAVEESAFAEDVSYTPTSSTPTTATAPTETTQTSPATTTEPTETTTTTTTEPTEPTETTTTTTSAGSTRAGSTGSSTGSGSTGSSSTGSSSAGSSSTSGSSSTGSSSSGSSTVTAATIDADKLQIVEDEQTVKEDRQALDQTRLRAPVSGTITSLESIAPGDSVSSGSTSTADSSSDSTSTTGSTALGSSSTGSSSTGSTSSSSSSSTSFAVIDSLKRLSMTVSFTEADINKLKVGQAAVVTLDALSNLELAGKVTDVSSIGTTTDDVTSYDATVTLNQYDARVKPGMSASAEVIIKQGHGVTVPSGAVTGSGTLATVTEEVDGKQKTKKVIVGIRGDSRDLIVSGVSSGTELVETETLPATGSSASTSSSSSGSATGGFGRRGLSGATGGFSGGGFPSGGFSGAGGGGPP
jgi:multidrug efflux pump subunit AcrA (membrane-fusion protein)